MLEPASFVQIGVVLGLLISLIQGVKWIYRKRKPKTKINPKISKFKCVVCGNDKLPYGQRFICNLCNEYVCIEHLLPEIHNCKNFNNKSKIGIYRNSNGKEFLSTNKKIRE